MVSGLFLVVCPCALSFLCLSRSVSLPVSRSLRLSRSLLISVCVSLILSLPVCLALSLHLALPFAFLSRVSVPYVSICSDLDILSYVVQYTT